MGLVVQATVAVSLAVHGVGAMSFAAGQVTGALVIGVFVLWSAHVPWRFGFDRAVARRLMTFGVPLAMALGIEAILLNADYVIVGRTSRGDGTRVLPAGVQHLGLGARRARHGHPLGLHPELLAAVGGGGRPGAGRAPVGHHARHRSPAHRLPHRRARPPLIEFLYGADWAPSAPVLRFLIILGVARMLTQLALDILTGRARHAPPSGSTSAGPWPWSRRSSSGHGPRARGAAIAHSLVVLLVALPLAFAAPAGSA